MSEARVGALLGAATLVAAPLSYWASRSSSLWVKGGAAVAVWSSYIGAFAISPPLPVATPSTLMMSCFGFIPPLKWTELIFFRQERLKRDYEAEEVEKMNKAPMWRDFLRFVGDFAWFAFPLCKVRKPEDEEINCLGIGKRLPSMQNTVLYALECLVCLVTKTVLNVVVFSKMWDLAHTEGLTAPFQGKQRLLFWFTASIVVGMAHLDLQNFVVLLVTGGRYKVLPFNRYPFLSVSLRELWGTRYNHLISSLLKECVYFPAKNRGFSSGQSGFLAFFASGVLHAWVAHITFRKGRVQALAFFCASGLLVGLETWVYKKRHWLLKLPAVVRASVTFFLFWVSYQLYGTLFMDSMPTFLEAGRSALPDASTQSFVYDAAKPLAALVGVHTLQQNPKA
uniref:Wax synthase domain-containing protein n=1 Tax=Chromera velia CCMP2878 TaxID=1169474 RepID=A0A0G4FRV6_9ALVE|eukprot:Cvel_18365.t1-p1 / transcript=Cvel_18365.t1 / gene=Cvel_18365 / organism=Chromera_velia_CCMP2878 / gene_product=Probable long-chain-alcohol O-fatty-acyltransferase, putative / transcript_product=Probable long-chain-alcohol O-fatty-acyltransferase, putative / location=Cvel_scaffold1517:32338-33519(-) / protein_length=394 / sequence_SO=supercontig / SO=protein_coding / is_pseudo=false